MLWIIKAVKHALLRLSESRALQTDRDSVVFGKWVEKKVITLNHMGWLVDLMGLLVERLAGAGEYNS